MSTTADRGGAIRWSPAFQGLTERDLFTIYNTGQVNKIQSGDVLYGEGDANGKLYLVLNGTFKVFKRFDGKMAEMATVRQGEWVSESSAEESAGRSSYVLAIEPSTVALLDEVSLKALDQGTQLAVLRSVADQALRRTHELARLSASLTSKTKKLSAFIATDLSERTRDYEASEMILKVIKNIPRLPMYVTRLTSLIADDKVSTRQVVELAKEDPSFVGAVLKTVNSSYYSFRGKISDFQHAVLLLGFNNVFQLAVDDGLRRTMPDKPEFLELQSHAALVAVIAQEICQTCKTEQPSLMSTIGLLHDIGKSIILLMKAQHPKMSVLIDLLDHATIGALVMKEWNIPQGVCQTVAYQSHAEFAPPADVPEDSRRKVGVLHIAHLCHEYLKGRGAEDLPGAFVREYLRVVNAPAASIPLLVGEHLLPAMLKKLDILPRSAGAFFLEGKKRLPAAK